MINEFPPHLRNKHLLLAGVWFGKSEPKMELFLEVRMRPTSCRMKGSLRNKVMT